MTTAASSSRRLNCVPNSPRCSAAWPATQVVQQCGSGVTACHNLLAMELAGLSGSKLYPGILERVVRRSGATGGARLGFCAVAP
jgi:hypothetical protein